MLTHGDILCGSAEHTLMQICGGCAWAEVGPNTTCSTRPFPDDLSGTARTTDPLGPPNHHPWPFLSSPMAVPGRSRLGLAEPRPVGLTDLIPTRAGVGRAIDGLEHDLPGPVSNCATCYSFVQQAKFGRHVE